MRVKGILIFATKLTKVISFHVIQHHQGIDTQVCTAFKSYT